MFLKSSNDPFKKAKVVQKIKPAKIAERIQETTIDEILEFIKKEDNLGIIEKIAKSMNPKERLQFCVKIAKESKFRSYKIGIDSFDRAVNKYLETDDKYDLTNYRDNLSEDYTDSYYSNFVLFRRAAISNIVDNECGYFMEAIHVFVNTKLALEEIEQEACYKEIVILLAETKWKEKAAALKALYG